MKINKTLKKKLLLTSADWVGFEEVGQNFGEIVHFHLVNKSVFVDYGMQQFDLAYYV